MDTKGILSLLGLAKKANKTSLGSRPTIEGIRKEKVKIVFITDDKQTDAIRQIKNKCSYYNVPIIEEISSLDISVITGMTNIKILGVTDQGIGELIKKLL